MLRLLQFLLIACAAILMPVQTWAISLGQLDAFSVPTDTLGWLEGVQSPNPPTQNIGLGADGAPGHLEIGSTGIGGAGGRQLFWNDLQWTGDYIAAGVDQISLFADNRSSNGQQIDLRLGFYGNSDWFVTDAFALADGSGWTPISFDVGPSDLIFATGSGGSGDATTTLSNVVRIEILSEAGSPFSTGTFDAGVLQGDRINSNLRIDEISTPAPPGPGDYDGNGTVEGNDYNVWKAAFGNSVAQPGDGADGNQNSVVDAGDYTIWRDAYGADSGLRSESVPEPSSLVLVLAIAVGLGRIRCGK